MESNRGRPPCGLGGGEPDEEWQAWNGSGAGNAEAVSEEVVERTAGFFLFASAYWALLPLVARSQIGGGRCSTAFFWV
jgi:hypothetical protein